MAGVLKPTAGKITVSGRTLPLLDLGAGFHPDLTGRENIILNGVLLGRTQKQILSKMDAILSFADLGDFIDEPIRIYSGGMVARLGFSVIACLDPEILLIDEVLGVGDKNFQDKCFERILKLKQSGVTIVFISHNLQDILKICDRVLWIADHGVKMDGEPKAVVDAYSQSKN